MITISSGFSDRTQIIGKGQNSAGMFIRTAEAFVDVSFPLSTGAGAGQINEWYDYLRPLAGGTITVTIGGTPTGGTFDLTITPVGTPFNPGQPYTAAALAYNATGATVQTAVRALASIFSAVTVTGGAGGPYVFTFPNSVGAKSVDVVLTNLTGGTPTKTIATAQIANPTTVLTTSAASTTGGALNGNTNVYVKYSYKNANGETLPNTAELTYAIPAGTNTNTVLVTAPALPSGATGINVYASATAGAEAFVGTSAGNTYTLAGYPAAGAAVPSPYNTTVITSETLNLTDGSLLDPFGTPLVFAGLSNIHIQNPSVTSPMRIGGGAGTFAGPLGSPSQTLWIPPGVTVSGQVRNGYFQLPAYGMVGGWQIKAGVNNLLNVSSFDPWGVTYGVYLPGNA